MPLAEPHRPVVVAGHAHAGVVEDVVDDEHQHRDDDGHAQSALADDGSERCADEEEDDARQGQRELADDLQPVQALLAVEHLGIVGLHAQVVERICACRAARSSSPRALVLVHGVEDGVESGTSSWVPPWPGGVSLSRLERVGEERSACASCRTGGLWSRWPGGWSPGRGVSGASSWPWRCRSGRRRRSG